jgi:hypothetical protein
MTETELPVEFDTTYVLAVRCNRRDAPAQLLGHGDVVGGHDWVKAACRSVVALEAL